MTNPDSVDRASKTEVLSTRASLAFRKRLEAVQLERGDQWLSDTVLALLMRGVVEHEKARAA